MAYGRIAAALSKLLPSDSPLRSPAKRTFEDLRSLARSFASWEYREAEAPETLSIETTNACNANCIFCAYGQQKNFRAGRGTMEQDLFERLLKEYHDLGGTRLSFTPLVGEALLDEQIIPRVRAAVDMGFEVGFHTNGLLLNRIDLDAFLATGLKSVCVSAAPLDRESHELLYRSQRYDDLVAGLQGLLEKRNAGGAALRITLHFRSHVSAKRVVDFPDYREIILPLLTPEERAEVGILVIGYDSWGGQIDAKDLTGRMSMALPPRLKRRPCKLTFSPQVLWDGKVRACPCFFGPSTGGDADDGLYLGDLNESSLADIWGGAAIRDLRRRFCEGAMPDLCRRCTSYRSV